MLFAVLSGFILALFTPFLQRIAGNKTGWLLAILPLSLTVYFASFIPSLGQGEVIYQQWQWLPGMDINLSFILDGLSLLFALLISFIGIFIFIYAGSYLKGHQSIARFFVIMLAFMASMLGLVLSDNLISLFVFWELTSITSYLLIGFDHEDESARRSALQGLFVTVGGGLALMAGLIMLATAGGSYQISELLSASDSLLESPLAVGMIICILLGTFTKSAQFPFHFWLPNAMAAPTPVSAYLHSATMVKAGIYLMARLNPAFTEHAVWTFSLSLFGAITMFVGAYLAYSATNIKKVLAYSTVMALGTLTMLLGIGTGYALIAFACFLLAHSLYKAALFMLAGAIDHEIGTKDLTLMGGLRSNMPRTALITALAALSLAGMPPLFGFIAKEAMFEAVLGNDNYQLLLLILALAAAMLVMAIAAVVAIKPFYGELRPTPKKPHEAPMAMLIGPSILAVLSLIFGLLPWVPQNAILSATVNAISVAPASLSLALWHGFNLPLLLSVIALAGGILLFMVWQKIRPAIGNLTTQLSHYGPEAGYFGMMNGITGIASWQTRLLQNGKLGNYMIVMILTTVILVGYTLLSQYGLNVYLNVEGVAFYELSIALLMLMATLYAIYTPSRLGAVASMGVLGFTVALVFIHFSAPDLGITQVLVETLTVILLILVLFKLPGFSRYSSRYEVIRDASVAVLMGVLMTLLILAAIDVQFFDSISDFFIESSYPLAKGRNIVNVILVDFRALDTLGEIFVLAIAALGVFSMLKLRAEEKS